MHKNHAPLIFLRVSHDWRRIAIDTPRPWASLHIPVPSSQFYIRYPEDLQFFSRVLRDVGQGTRDWLERSGVCPLNISLSNWDAGSIEKDDKGILSQILKFASRWKRISLNLSSAQLSHVARLSEADVPLLESLTIDQSRGTPHDLTRTPGIWVPSRIFKAPRLHELSLTQVREDISKFSVNWGQLTSLTLQAGDNALSFMRGITEMPKPSTRPDDIPSISLPHLKELAVFENMSNCTPFMKALDAPSLQAVEIYSSAGPAPPSVFHLISRASSPIRSFASDFSSFSRKDFLQLRVYCPRLTTLAVRTFNDFRLDPTQNPGGPREGNDMQIDNTFLSVLNSTNANGDYRCPKLTTLECFTGVKISDAGILDFLRKREESDERASIKNLRTQFKRPQKDPIAGPLKPFLENGLDAGLWYPALQATSPFCPADDVGERLSGFGKSPSYDRHEPGSRFSSSNHHRAADELTPTRMYTSAIHPNRKADFREVAPPKSIIKEGKKEAFLTCTNCSKIDGSGGCELKRCEKCKIVYYCSRDCQKEHWEVHKTQCQEGLGTGIQPLIAAFVGNPMLQHYLQLLLCWEFLFHKVPDSEREALSRKAFHAHIDVGIEPTKIADFMNLYTYDDWDKEALEGMLQIHLVATAHSGLPQIPFTDKMMYLWQTARDDADNEGCTKSPVVVVQFINDMTQRISWPITIDEDAFDSARRAPPFTMVSALTRKAIDKPMSVDSILEYVNTHIRSDTSNRLLLRVPMRECDKRLIRDAGRNKDAHPAQALRVKMNREAVYVSHRMEIVTTPDGRTERRIIGQLTEADRQRARELGRAAAMRDMQMGGEAVPADEEAVSAGEHAAPEAPKMNRAERRRLEQQMKKEMKRRK
ncbi:unnamed protein product [Cyclocybe aegerita]|uniref:MYND-type domain-containing protein n=1 Tax=Cyclocybe aegerita TaxID=1973307 RepID=A0A8S0X0K4_CYCAE|nr:unnamed protein product [Cyclocybe aegerita]